MGVWRPKDFVTNLTEFPVCNQQVAECLNGRVVTNSERN
jgi:hypothetical protein